MLQDVSLCHSVHFRRGIRVAYKEMREHVPLEVESIPLLTGANQALVTGATAGAHGADEGQEAMLQV